MLVKKKQPTCQKPLDLKNLMRLFFLSTVLKNSCNITGNHNISCSQAYIKKGVHQFRFFLPAMRTPNSIVICSWMYAFLLKCDPMRTPRCGGVRIGCDFHKNAYMHEQTTIGIHKEEVPKLVYTLFCCKPVC